MPGESRGRLFLIVYHVSYINSARTIIHRRASLLHRGEFVPSGKKYPGLADRSFTLRLPCNFRDIIERERDLRSLSFSRFAERHGLLISATEKIVSKTYNRS